jgi:hypothetical protein
VAKETEGKDKVLVQRPKPQKEREVRRRRRERESMVVFLMTTNKHNCCGKKEFTSKECHKPVCAALQCQNSNNLFVWRVGRESITT